MENSSDKDTAYSYAKSGVSIAAGNALVKAIAPLARATARAGADADLGGFGGFFDPKAAGFKDPLLVAANDGVGTKVKLAIDHDRHDEIGIDLVAMCVNDLIVQGAEPLFFLDYFATGKLENGIAERVVAGIADGCKLAGCALSSPGGFGLGVLGGATAEVQGGTIADCKYYGVTCQEPGSKATVRTARPRTAEAPLHASPVGGYLYPLAVRSSARPLARRNRRAEKANPGARTVEKNVLVATKASKTH